MFGLRRKFVNQGIFKNQRIEKQRLRSLLKVFWLIAKILMESAMFDFQSWASNGPNVANFVIRFVIRQVRSLEFFEIHWHISVL